MNSSECIFCKIGKNEIPSLKLYESETVVAFLDINPATKGHTLVIPKTHYENIYEIDNKTMEKISREVKKICKHIKERLKPEGINVLQNNGQKAGQVVKHFHIHIIPRYPEDQVTIALPHNKGDEKELKEVMAQLSGKEQKQDTTEPEPEPNPDEEELKISDEDLDFDI